jgi:hypothetical protein
VYRGLNTTAYSRDFTNIFYIIGSPVLFSKEMK